jgi:hypothetical protein
MIALGKSACERGDRTSRRRKGSTTMNIHSAIVTATKQA